jgi:hypothetical protein
MCFECWVCSEKWWELWRVSHGGIHGGLLREYPEYLLTLVENCVVLFRGLLLFSLPFIVDSFCVVVFNFTFGLPLLNYLCTVIHEFIS